jgi:hypothetical protein
MELPTDIKNIIADYTAEYKFVEYTGKTHWMVLEKTGLHIVDSHYLSLNPAALFILEANQKFINWECLCKNQEAIHFIEQNLDKLDKRCWEESLSNNESPRAIRLIEQNVDKLSEKSWWYLSKNESAFDMMVKHHFDKIVWYGLCLNRNPKAIDLLEKNLDKIDWEELSKNPNAIRLLENNIDKIYWKELSENPNAVHILEKNIDKIIWRRLMLNKSTGAIELLKQSPEEMYWYWLNCNPYAIEMIKKQIKSSDNLDEAFSKKSWDIISENTHPDAITLLKSHFKRIDWELLSYNKNAIPLLKMNISKIYHHGFIANPKVIPVIDANLEKLLWTTGYKENEKFYKLVLRRVEF